MRTGIFHWILPALLLGLGCSHLFAQDRNLGVAPTAASEQRAALVIGNSNYKEAPLRNPVNDATDMAATLRALGFAVTLRTNADTRQMRTAIREFVQNLKRGGVGLFYFAGHGVQSRNGRNYLIPVGADLKEEFELEDEAVDANRVLAGMEEAGNRVNIVILDACRNNPFARSWRSTVNGLAQMSAPTGSFVGFATAPGQVAADGSGRNGLYTKHLLENLKAGDPDIDRVFTRVTAAVAKETGNKQVPWKSSSLTGDFYFRPQESGVQAVAAPPAAPAVLDPSANDRAFWDSAKNSKNPEEFKAYLELFPSGLFVPLAQARLKALEVPPVASVMPSVPLTSPPIRSENQSSRNDPDRVSWAWPAEGGILRTYSDQTKGIAIAAKMGDPVFSAATGRIVYAGSGLRGYGNLILVKHNSTYLSAYAHNSKLIVREGQMVTQGERIAEAGNTESDTVQIHFEIRQFGKPVDPLAFLPTRN